MMSMLWLAFILFGGLQGPDDWEATWNKLERLKSMTREDPAAMVSARELSETASAAEEDPRTWLLRAQLEKWAGRDPGMLAQRLSETSAQVFSVRESWLLAEVLPRGLPRVNALLRAMDQTPTLTQEALLFAWSVSVEEARDLRLAEGALPIQQRLHARYRAPWSAIDLAHTLSLLGRMAEADAILAEAIGQEEAARRPAADLWSQRGIIALGGGDGDRGRDYLGRALAQGSQDAALVLGRLDLAGGRLDAARKGFRPPILSGDDTGWSLRGWGQALLPEAHARALRPSMGPGTRIDH